MSGESTVMPPRKLHDADVVYLYDGSFEGFLCCVFESFAQHEIPFAVWTPQRETATLYPVRDIETDSARAQRVFSALGRKLGRETEYLVSRDFLSGQEDKELLLIRFLHLAFALGPGTVKRMGHPDVAPLYEMKKSLDWEVDKFQGFVRFEEHDGMLGAVIHPKNYILPLLRGHFCSRFPEENFMIYDAVHQAVLLYQEHKAQLLELAAPLELPPPSAREQEFQALWNEINHKYTYRVEFDSEELIRKSIKSIDENLFVSRLSYTLKTGSQKKNLEDFEVKDGRSFESRKEETKELKKSGSTVKYDLVGEIAEGATITRRTAVSILKGIEERKFAMFAENPEEFISKVSKLINDEKATLIVDHITYNRIDDTYDSSIFTESKANCDPSKAFQGSKHIMDYVFTDGLAEESVEKRFAQSLDRADEVAVYAKLPKGFKIPTPVGNYSPDWAIAFDDSKGIKHIFFIAETKGSMESMQLKPIERAKIHCAEKVYNVDGSNVRYHHVDTYDNLLKLIRDME